jgi:LmbE family N-acetylglucosaminyl deacetylase
VTTSSLSVPERVLAIGAHPDDIEFGCGATLAKWSAAGSHVHMCICTDGSKGTWDPGADTRALIARREDEQRDAAAVLGVADVTFLRFVDGELVNDRAAQDTVCRLLRVVRPDVVLTHDPLHPSRIHPDHHQAGALVIAAIVAARDPHFFPEQGLEPHRPSMLLLFDGATPDHVERVDGYVERKVEALLRHRSQWRSTMDIDEHGAKEVERQQARFARQITDEAQADGIRGGVRAGEAFRRLTEL